MTFEEFLILIRKKHIGDFFNDKYWHQVYQHDLVERTEEYIKKELPFLAVRALGQNYEIKYKYNKL